MFNTTRDTTLV